MRLSLSESLRLNHALNFTGLICFALLTPCFAAFFAAYLYLSVHFHDWSNPGSLASGALGLLVGDLALRHCFRRRLFLLKFARWTETEHEPLQERRALAMSARDAFMSGDFPKSARLLERYLEARPADNALRLNLASCLALEGRFEEAAALLRVAGDPRSQLKYLDSRGAWWGYLFMTSPFKPLQALRFQAAGPLALFLAAALGLSAGLALRESGKIAGLLALADAEGLQEKDFLRHESANLTVFYHDEAALKALLPIAEGSLAYNLAFLNMPSDQFASHKIRVFLCSDRKEYMRRSPFASPWEAGAAIPSKNVFYTYPQEGRMDGYFLETVAHELCHICYYQFIPNIGQDSWLNEGLARYQGFNYLCDYYHLPASAWVLDHVFKDIAKNPLPFDLFLHHRPQELAAVKDVSQFYNQGHSMVFVLIHYYGKDSFIKLLHEFSRSQDLNQAFAASYDTIHSLDDLRSQWTLFMK